MRGGSKTRYRYSSWQVEVTLLCRYRTNEVKGNLLYSFFLLMYSALTVYYFHCCQIAEFWAAGLKNGLVKILAA
jgi:hypothetical protein